MIKKKSLPHIILASQSPRRRAMLDALDLAYETRGSSYIEAHAANENPCEVVMRHAREKAASVVQPEDRKSLIIGADTIVYKNDQILGKPKDMADAHAMLTMLQGSRHIVYTGVAVYNACAEEWHITFATTSVSMRALSSEEIDAYITQVYPLDKAGAYAIQELGGIIIDKIDGCYYNVLGFPVAVLEQLIGQCGYSLLTGEKKQ
jgi:septum formation protein